MKFIIQCLTCCLAGLPPYCPETATLRRSSEETIPLALSYPPSFPVRRPTRRRRKRLRSVGSMDDWQPTLDAINEEDDVVNAVERENRSNFGSGTVMKKRKVPRRSKVRDHGGNHRTLRLIDLMTGFHAGPSMF